MSNPCDDLAQTRSSETRSGLEAEDPYEYQALRTSATIRLVKIFPERVKGCITCRIYHFDEEEQKNIQYRALSYVWGNPQATRQILLKGPNDEWRPFPLHENLWRFLNHAWEQKMFEQFFWTDRLCLNQDSPEEISQQVPRMRTIYKNAELALIWMNLKEEEERALVELERHYDSYYEPAMRGETVPKKPSIDEDTMLEIINNPYWARVWIVQEVVLSREVCVTCRDTLIPEEKMYHIIQWFHDNNYSPDQLNWIMTLDNMRRSGGNWPLSKILIEFAGHQSSLPVDRLYGMLGLVKNNDDGSSPTDNIQVDYGRPILHVFLDAMFESSPFASEYHSLRECLGDQQAYESHSLLEGYITDSKTTQRHKDLAQLALQALEACSILTSGPGAPSETFLVYSTIDMMCGITPDWETTEPITLEQNATIIGITLARSSSGPLDHWKARWRSRGKASSPWRCLAHRSADEPSYETIIGTSLSEALAPECVVEACGERSQSCDGSPYLQCEIPEVGLRLWYSGGRCQDLSIDRRQPDS